MPYLNLPTATWNYLRNIALMVILLFGARIVIELCFPYLDAVLRSNFLTLGESFRWSQYLLPLHVFSDVVVSLSCLIAGTGLLSLARQAPVLPRRDVPVLLASLFFLLALTFLVQTLLVWRPWYWFTSVWLIAVSIVIFSVSQHMKQAFQDIIAFLNRGEAITVSNELLRRVFDTLPIPISIYDRDLRFVAVSKEWEEVFNQDKKEVLGYKIMEVLPEVHSKWIAQYEQCVRGEIPSCDISDSVERKGKKYLITRKVVPLKNAAGEIEHIIMFTDKLDSQPIEA